MKRRTADAARGKWRGILLSLGIDQSFLSGKHGPCPVCGGSDRFRWDNQHGAGGFICSQCGAGNGFDLLMRVHGWDFAATAAKVDEVLGNVDADPPTRPAMSKEDRNRMLNRLWASATALQQGDLAYAYLAGRNALPKVIPACLRFAPDCPAPDGQSRPAMLALVHDADGAPCTIHRTFLGPDGKADMASPRALMPGEIADGSAVRLSPVHGELLGIAEGIETALAATARFGVPVWAALNATMLGKWQPPGNVRQVVVFGDNDRTFTGQAVAYALARRLAAQKGLAVEVRIPGRVDTDWADENAA